MNFRRRAFIALLFLAGISSAVIAVRWQTQRQWFALQTQQRATILQLERFPPTGWERDIWNNFVGLAHNVWGNVVYSPSCSQISNEEMLTLKMDLDRILAETTPHNSIESVDRVYRLLQRRGKNIEFISMYRDSFRTYVDTKQEAF